MYALILVIKDVRVVIKKLNERLFVRLTTSVGMNDITCIFSTRLVSEFRLGRLKERNRLASHNQIRENLFQK